MGNGRFRTVKAYDVGNCDVRYSATSDGETVHIRQLENGKKRWSIAGKLSVADFNEYRASMGMDNPYRQTPFHLELLIFQLTAFRRKNDTSYANDPGISAVKDGPF